MSKPLSLIAAFILCVCTTSAGLASNDVRISQVYGGGGGTTGTPTYGRDYIELFNNSGAAVDMSGWAIEYGSSTGNWGSNASNRFVFSPGTVIQGHRYFLIAMPGTGPGGTPNAGAPLPVAPDIDGMLFPAVSGPQLTMSATNGKVALFTALNANTACGSELPGTLVDKVGYGTANCPEGTSTPAMTNMMGAVRNGNGSTDTDDNSADFTVVTAPMPRNSASGAVNSAVILERVWNDCPFSTLTTTNNYASLISITDSGPVECSGFANLHVWRFSTDGANELLFDNNASYSFDADVTISGTGEAEAGLQIAPWWSESDGRFNIRTIDGEIACFGGRLPFYSFTLYQGLQYVRGTTVHLEIIYTPNGLSAVSPATIEYRYTDSSGLHTSGPISFDEGNPAEDPPHGVWGQLNEAKVGGYFQYQLNGLPDSATATWADIGYSNNAATPSYTITASAGAGGTISPDGAVIVGSGANQAFTISANACRHVADVLVDGVSVGAVTAYTFNNVGTDHTIAASFASDQAAVTLQPVSQTVCSGSPAGFSVTSIGTPAPTYQWRKAAVDIGGATSSTLSFGSALPADAGSYDVVVTNSCGADTSDAATLTVRVAPAITLQPAASQTVCAGNPAGFSVSVTGTPPLTFQWRKGTVDIAGATSNTYSIPLTAAAHAGSYDVIVTNACGADTSSVGNLTVNVAPAFSPKPPSQVKVALGFTAVISTVVTGTPQPTLQWYRGTTPLSNNSHYSGVTTPTLSISNVTYSDAAYYRLLATNSCGQLTGNPQTYLWVVACPSPPVISQQPASQSIPNGAPVTFSVAASSCVQPQYQWARSTTGPTNYILGATQSTFTIPSIAPGDRGVYWCLVSTNGWITTSRYASLNVLDPVIQYQSANYSGYNGCTDVFIYWYTIVPTTGVISFGEDCANLTGSTPPTGLSTFGSVVIPRPPSGVLYYKLTVTMPSSAQAQSTCRTWVFPGGPVAPYGTAITYPYYVQRLAPDDGIPVGISIKNYGCTTIPGPIEVVSASLNNAPPLDPQNPLMLPATVTTHDLPAGQSIRMPTDLVFSRSQVGGVQGTRVLFRAYVRYPVGSTTGTIQVFGWLTLP